MRSHIKSINYTIQIGDEVISKVAIYNCNKLPEGIVYRCLEHDTFSKYLLTMTKEHFEALFLDDGELNLSEDGIVPTQAPVEPITDQESAEDKEDKKDDDNQISNN